VKKSARGSLFRRRFSSVIVNGPQDGVREESMIKGVSLWQQDDGSNFDY
jgi:hypothetical protein